ncbi:MAG TPA: response regulator [Labilithrix sp.]|jgi:CheY-like chemotaxis protein
MARYLVVDDDHATVTAMARLLRGDGHEVAPFTSGADAVDALAREPFDAVVTDLEMPRVTGQAVVEATRLHQPHACIVVVTSAADGDVRALIDAGVCVIADKPIDYDEVTAGVRECRASGGSGLHGRCHLRSHKGEPKRVRLRRK